MVYTTSNNIKDLNSDRLCIKFGRLRNNNPIPWSDERNSVTKDAAPKQQELVISRMDVPSARYRHYY